METELSIVDTIKNRDHWQRFEDVFNIEQSTVDEILSKQYKSIINRYIQLEMGMYHLYCSYSIYSNSVHCSTYLNRLIIDDIDIPQTLLNELNDGPYTILFRHAIYNRERSEIIEYYTPDIRIFYFDKCNMTFSLIKQYIANYNKFVEFNFIGRFLVNRDPIERANKLLTTFDMDTLQIYTIDLEYNDTDPILTMYVNEVDNNKCIRIIKVNLSGLTENNITFIQCNKVYYTSNCIVVEAWGWGIFIDANICLYIHANDWHMLDGWFCYFQRINENDRTNINLICRHLKSGRKDTYNIFIPFQYDILRPTIINGEFTVIAEHIYGSHESEHTPYIPYTTDTKCINVETNTLYSFEPNNPDHFIDKYVPVSPNSIIPFKFAD